VLDMIDRLELGELDLDGESGCKFLRVMLSLIMHNYPQLVYGALELLFRHFSQRQEVLQAFKQASIDFWATVCKTVCPMLSERCPVCTICL